MNWTEQADALMRTWADAQKKVWEGWYDMARKAPGGQSDAGLPGGTDPMAWLRDSMGAWTRAAGETGQGAVGNIFTSQNAMMRSLEVLTKAWQTVAPNMEAGKDWKPDLKSFTDQWIKQAASGGPTGGAGDPGKLFQSFLGEWAPLLKPLLASLGQNAMSGHMGGAMLGGTEGLSRLLNLEKEFEPLLEGFSGLPNLGLTREQNAKLLNAFDAYVDLQKASQDYQMVLAEGMGKAIQETMEKLAGIAEKGEKVETVRELMRIWVGVADQTFMEMYATERYYTAQKDMSAAGMKHRLAQREVAEVFLKHFDLPTRSELDDAYKTLYELKKEVRALKKSLKEERSAAKTPTREKPVAKKKSTKKKTASGKAQGKQVRTTG